MRPKMCAKSNFFFCTNTRQIICWPKLFRSKADNTSFLYGNCLGLGTYEKGNKDRIKDSQFNLQYFSNHIRTIQLAVGQQKKLIKLGRFKIIANLK